MWSDIDLQMTLSLAAIMKVGNNEALDIFHAIPSNKQVEVLRNLARRSLAGKDLSAFNALIEVFGSLKTKRNDLAHGIFGIAEEFPNDLLWCGTQEHANFLLDVYINEYKGLPLADPHKKLREYLYVYTSHDLESLLKDFTELQKAAFLFHSYQQPRKPKPSENYLTEMLSLPSIKRAHKV